MQRPTWRFREKQRAELHQDPANTEFFAQQDVAERLVRESAQNAIDATRAGELARLKFTRIRTNPGAWEPYFKSLWPHLEAQPELRESLPCQGGSIECLLVEDFGTTGLTGPLEPNDRIEAERDEKSHRLFWFFKNVGRTSKTGDQLGSFGIGKTVFPYSSRINTFFGYSTRAVKHGEHPIVLLGQSQLREHRLDPSVDLDPFGFFAYHEGKGSAYVQREINEPSHLDHFRDAFGIRRQRDECGLSVVIPYPADELTRVHLARAALAQFFFPILSQQLVIEIHDGDPIILSADSLLETIGNIGMDASDADELRNRVRLARWAVGEGRRSIQQLARPKNVKQPQFDANMIDADARLELGRRFVAGDRLALCVPVPVEPKATEPVWSHVEVFLEYDHNGDARNDLYVRKGLTLIDHTGHARQPGLRAILVAEDPAIYELLRSSENVAHTAWRQRGAERLTHQYHRGTFKVKYVLGTTRGVVEALLSPEDESDWWTLADLFPEPAGGPLRDLPGEAADGDKGNKGCARERTQTEDQDFDPIIPPIDENARSWRAIAIRDGIRILGNPNFDGDLRPLRFTAVYGLLNRRKLSAHHQEDFSFQRDPDMLAAQRADLRVIDHNALTVTPTAHDFVVEITGFDRRRALDYRVSVEDE